MPENKKLRFVFNDPSQKNSYGFYVLTSGIALQRFNGNPIMLDDHRLSNHTVLGRWLNISVEGDLLMAEPEFDTAEPSVQKIAGQVERGFIKSCSMGFFFDPKDLKLIDGKLVLTKCELYECSIVPVPSNSNSVALYIKDENGKAQLMDQEKIQQLCLSIQTASQLENHNTNNMKKVTLSAAAFVALGMKDTTEEVDVDAINAKVLALSSENEKNKADLKVFRDSEETAKLKAVQDKVTAARLAGKIDATEEAEYVQLGVLNPTVLDSTLAKLSGKKSLNAEIEKGAQDPSEVKTAEDFFKLDDAARLSFKNENMSQYLKIFTPKN
ncbi:HK97 family phage prohead protease [Wenyingzhuangia heitensis]|uniref:HK97 family phage prohead protease n=1 Tax=Wenyingzhuangia heitensis TaxID=1487859 RepID=A0ABX0U872_9FLAO|nr:HK97 family phage prohead protease [Wenyingzhuangia heitensis]NIJ45052.1 HK97 family phage prohead protease [Wenyingzhuangia heitensis]